jgi:hypothetical protein
MPLNIIKNPTLRNPIIPAAKNPMKIYHKLDVVQGNSLAFSLTLTNSNYTKALFRVRRDSDNAETDIYPNTEGLPSGASNFCGAANGFLHIWYDQTGQGYNALTVTASCQPMIVDGGKLLSGVYFNGSATYLSIPNSTSVPVLDIHNPPATWYTKFYTSAALGKYGSPFSKESLGGATWQYGMFFRDSPSRFLFYGSPPTSGGGLQLGIFDKNNLFNWTEYEPLMVTWSKDGTFRMYSNLVVTASPITTSDFAWGTPHTMLGFAWSISNPDSGTYYYLSEVLFFASALQISDYQTLSRSY